MKIAIDLGHGVENDTGAKTHFGSEESFIDEVGEYVIEMFRGYGHDVVECRPLKAFSTAHSLKQRVEKANIKKCDKYISLHFNCGRGEGCEVYTYLGQKHSEAVRVLENMSKLGFKNRGVKNSNLYVIKNTNMKAFLIEVCFIDTASDINIFKNVGAYEVAKGIVQGFLGINEVIKVGDRVKVIKNINYDTNKPFKLWYNNYEVISIKGDRVVIGVGGTVTSAIHKNNIVKV